MKVTDKALEQLNARADWQGIFLDGDGSQRHILCPVHKDTSPSLAVYPDHAYCFGACRQPRHDLVNLYAQVFLNAGPKVSRREFQRAFAEVWNQVQRGAVRSLEDERTEPLGPYPISVVLRWESQMQPEHYAWLEHRYTISRSVAETVHLGFTGSAISIPHLDLEGQVQDVKFRFYTPPSFKGEPDLRYWSLKHRRPTTLYPACNVQRLLRVPEPVLLMEGELDVLAALSHGVFAVGVGEGAGTPLTQFEELWRTLRGERVGLVYDDDGAGTQATERALSVLLPFGVLATDARNLLEGHKDVSTLYAARRKVV